MTRNVSRSLLMASLVAGLLAAAPSNARAQGFVSGLVGYNFGGDAGCASATNCEDKHTNFGGSIGTLGIIGFEEELAYAKNFFGAPPAGSTTGGNSVLTLMSNLMIAPAIGPVNPYVTGGVGLMRLHTDFTPAQLINVTNSQNQIAWDVGGGVIGSFGHVGVRGDLRHFHSFKDSSLPLIGSLASGEKLNFGRIAGSIVLKF